MSEGAVTSPDTRGELIGRLKSKLKETMVSLKAAEERAVKAEGDATTARQAASEAETKFNADPLKAEVDRLRGELRTRNHRSAFDRIAAERGADKDSLEILYQTSGYQADKDEVDEAAIGTLIDGLKARPGVGRLFGEPAAPIQQPAPGKGQGGKPENQGARLRVTQAQLRDPDWCAKNNGARARAIAAGTLDIVD